MWGKVWGQLHLGKKGSEGELCKAGKLCKVGGAEQGGGLGVRGLPTVEGQQSVPERCRWSTQELGWGWEWEEVLSILRVPSGEMVRTGIVSEPRNTEKWKTIFSEF